MSVSSIGGSTTVQFNPFARSASSQKPATAANSTQPKDADGDNDGDTSASDKKGLDVRG